MAYDLKYGKITAEHGDRVHGKPGVPLNESDEPVFIIRSQDLLGPTVVRNYAESASRHGASAELVASAYAAADKMSNWQGENPGLVKVPD